MATFNWIRAAEGALVSAILSGTSAAEVSLANHSLTTGAIITSVAVTVLISFIKGLGQQYQDALVTTTQITQPANSTSLTETTVTTPGGK